MCPQAVPCKLLGVAAVPTCVAMLENGAGEKKGRMISFVASGLHDDSYFITGLAAVLRNMAFEKYAYRYEIKNFGGIGALMKVSGFILGNMTHHFILSSTLPFPVLSSLLLSSLLLSFPFSPPFFFSSLLSLFPPPLLLPSLLSYSPLSSSLLPPPLLPSPLLSFSPLPPLLCSAKPML